VWIVETFFTFLPKAEVYGLISFYSKVLNGKEEESDNLIKSAMAMSLFKYLAELD